MYVCVCLCVCVVLVSHPQQVLYSDPPEKRSTKNAMKRKNNDCDSPGKCQRQELSTDRCRLMQGQCQCEIHLTIKYQIFYICDVLTCEIMERKFEEQSNCIHRLTKNEYASTFIPRCMECRRGLAMRIVSVRLSVCHTRAL